MSFLNDRAIRRLCVPPSFVHVPAPELRLREDATLGYLSAPYNTHELDVTAAINRGAKFIKTADGGLIEKFDKDVHPFEPMIEEFRDRQVRYRVVPSDRVSPPENVVQTVDDLYTMLFTLDKPLLEDVVKQTWYVKEQDNNYMFQPIVSYGLTSAGYDVRLGSTFKVFTNIGGVIDPLNQKEQSFHEVETDELIIPPNSYALGHTVEYFRVPKNIIIACVGKSTYARAGLAVNVTPIEPGFHGTIVIELANQTPLPIKVYANQGISQFLFGQMTDDAEVSYADRKGKYQGQTGVVIARS